jgi:hypothetical protein
MGKDKATPKGGSSDRAQRSAEERMKLARRIVDDFHRHCTAGAPGDSEAPPSREAMRGTVIDLLWPEARRRDDWENSDAFMERLLRRGGLWQRPPWRVEPTCVATPLAYAAAPDAETRRSVQRWLERAQGAPASAAEAPPHARLHYELLAADERRVSVVAEFDGAEAEARRRAFVGEEPPTSGEAEPDRAAGTASSEAEREGERHVQAASLFFDRLRTMFAAMPHDLYKAAQQNHMRLLTRLVQEQRQYEARTALEDGGGAQQQGGAAPEACPQRPALIRYLKAVQEALAFAPKRRLEAEREAAPVQARRRAAWSQVNMALADGAELRGKLEAASRRVEDGVPPERLIEVERRERQERQAYEELLAACEEARLAQLAERVGGRLLLAQWEADGDLRGGALYPPKPGKREGGGCRPQVRGIRATGAVLVSLAPEAGLLFVADAGRLQVYAARPNSSSTALEGCGAPLASAPLPDGCRSGASMACTPDGRLCAVFLQQRGRVYVYSLLRAGEQGADDAGADACPAFAGPPHRLADDMWDATALAFDDAHVLPAEIGEAQQLPPAGRPRALVVGMRTGLLRSYRLTPADDGRAASIAASAVLWLGYALPILRICAHARRVVALTAAGVHVCEDSLHITAPLTLGGVDGYQRPLSWHELRLVPGAVDLAVRDDMALVARGTGDLEVCTLSAEDGGASCGAVTALQGAMAGRREQGASGNTSLAEHLARYYMMSALDRFPQALPLRDPISQTAGLVAFDRHGSAAHYLHPAVQWPVIVPVQAKADS